MRLDDALRLIEARRAGEWWTQISKEREIGLNDEEAERFLDALDHPGRFDAGIERLKASAATYRGV